MRSNTVVSSYNMQSNIFIFTASRLLAKLNFHLTLINDDIMTNLCKFIFFAIRLICLNCKNQLYLQNYHNMVNKSKNY